MELFVVTAFIHSIKLSHSTSTDKLELEGGRPNLDLLAMH